MFPGWLGQGAQRNGGPTYIEVCEALVTRSDALVPSSFTNSFLLQVCEGQEVLGSQDGTPESRSLLSMLSS